MDRKPMHLSVPCRFKGMTLLNRRTDEQSHKNVLSFKKCGTWSKDDFSIITKHYEAINDLMRPLTVIYSRVCRLHIPIPYDRYCLTLRH